VHLTGWLKNVMSTGESLPRGRDANPSLEKNLLQSRNILLAGTCVASGAGKAAVFATGITGMHTEFGRFAHLTQALSQALSGRTKLTF
jgi:sodium/potassium-transporting ATPase subunit alpha